MSLRLEKLVEDIKQETIVWPIVDAKESLEQEAAWARIGAKHKMTGQHVRSIFKVLSKKYEVEKAKSESDWKLFDYLKFLDIKKEENPDNEAGYDAEDGEEFVELLEVNEEYCSDDDEPNTSGASGSENCTGKVVPNNEQQQNIPYIAPNVQVRKIPNEKVNPVNENSKNNGILRKGNENSFGSIAASLNKDKIKQENARKSASPVSTKKIIKIPASQLSKTIIESSNNSNRKTQAVLTQALKLALKKNEKLSKPQIVPNVKEVKKRKISDNISGSMTNENDEELHAPPKKKQIILPKGIKIVPTKNTTIVSNAVTSTQEDMKESTVSSNEKLPPFSSFLKKSPGQDQAKNATRLETERLQYPAVSPTRSSNQNVTDSILQDAENPTTSPSKAVTNKNNSMDNTEAKLEIEQISKDADENTEIKVKVLTEQAEKILPTFFRDLYNSTKYDSFGMYVASTMNRLPSRLASKLEAKILQSIIEVNSIALEQEN